MFKEIKSYDGTKIRYRILKKNKPFLVFIHGLTGNYTGYLHQLNFFESEGYSTLALDLRGHGKSAVPVNNNFKVESMAKDVSKIFDKEGIKKAVIVGHCFGGAIAMVFCKLFPEKTRGLILINSTYKNPLETTFLKCAKYLTPVLKAVYGFISLVSGNSTKHRNKDIDFTKIRKWPNFLIIGVSTLWFTNPYTVFSCHKEFLNFDGTEILRNLDVRTLIIAGEKDKFFPVNVPEKMKELIKKSELKIIKNRKHLTILKEPDEVNKLMHEFLENV